MSSRDPPCGGGRAAFQQVGDIGGGSPPDAIDAVSHALAREQDPQVMAVNAYAPITDPDEVASANVVKTVFRADGRALTFSRSAVPYPQTSRPVFLRQLGLYGFTPEGLATFAGLRPGPVERAESIEMLRFLEHGHGARMVEVQDNGVAVDTREDLGRAELLLSRHQADTAP